MLCNALYRAIITLCNALYRAIIINIFRNNRKEKTAMLAMLAMLVPPVFMAVLWNKLFFGKEERKTKNNCLVYLCCLMAVNFTAILITSYIRDEPGNIAYNINNSGIFALKYMLLTKQKYNVATDVLLHRVLL